MGVGICTVFHALQHTGDRKLVLSNYNLKSWNFVTKQNGYIFIALFLNPKNLILNVSVIK